MKSVHGKASRLLALAVAVSVVQFAYADLPAFPGAEGPGSNATGGRAAGADVYHVTSLADDRNGTIPGTLRNGLVTAPAAGRTIVFDVGGVIQLVPDVNKSTGTWLRTGNSNITIAGQTAPGPGITVIGQGTKLTGSNVIMRNLKLRPGQDQQRPGILTNDGFSNYLQNSIVDHVSVSWADDEGLSSTDAVNNTTVQYSIIAQGLNYTLNDGTKHAMGSLISSQNNDAKISYHHNLYAHMATRNPRLGSEAGTGAIANFSNNVIYNWTGRAGYSVDLKPSRTNYLSNYYIAGPNNIASDRVFYSPDVNTQIFHANTNVVDMNKNGTPDGVTFGFTGSQFQGTYQQAVTPFDVPSGYVQTAAQAVPQVLSYAGAQWWNRDYIDAKIVSDTTSGTGSIINYVTDAPKSTDPLLTYDAKGFPQYAAVSRAANFDTDQDGMPDTWEKAHHLNPLVADNKGDFDNDGYTNLEEYLNDLGAFPAPTTIGFRGTAGGRYADILNWGIAQTYPGSTGLAYTPWQPSRYDAALISAGTVTVDAVGQHAKILQVSGVSAVLQISAGWLDVSDQLNITNGALDLRGGELRVHKLNCSPGGILNFLGGTLLADDISAAFTNRGCIISPGSVGGVGLMTVAGNMTLESGALWVEIGSLVACDQWSIAGSAALGGNLLVTLADGLTPAYGSEWLIMSSTGGISGTFDTLPPGYQTQIRGTSLYLVAIPEPGSLGLLFTWALFLRRRR